MFFVIFYLIFSLLMLLVVIAAFAYMCSLFLTRASFVPLPKDKVSAVLQALQLQSGSIFYDLGSGNGRIVIAASRVSNASCIGVDSAVAAHVAATLALWKVGSPKNVKILYKNLFTLDLSNASHVFCYLYPTIVADLEHKFQSELPPGARVVSCDFKLPNKSAAEIIPLQGKSVLGKTLYVYEY